MNSSQDQILFKDKLTSKTFGPSLYVLGRNSEKKEKENIDPEKWTHRWADIEFIIPSFYGSFAKGNLLS